MPNYTGATRAAAAQNIQSGPELPDFLKDAGPDEGAPDEMAPEEPTEEALTGPEKSRLEGIASGHGFDEAQVADVVSVVEEFLGGAPTPEAEEAPVEEAPVEEMA